MFFVYQQFIELHNFFLNLEFFVTENYDQKNGPKEM